MRPQVDSRTHFTWKCEKCGETITQKKRLKTLRTPEKDLLCVGCKHFSIDFGEPDYSEHTPGSAPSLDCSESVFKDLDGDDLTEISFHKVIRTARTCDKFEVRVVS